MNPFSGTYDPKEEMLTCAGSTGRFAKSIGKAGKASPAFYL